MIDLRVSGGWRRRHGVVWCPLRGAVHVYLSVALSVVRPGGPGSRLSLPPPRGGLAVRGECRLASPRVECAPYALFLAVLLDIWIHQLGGPCLLGGSALRAGPYPVWPHVTVSCKEAYRAPPAGRMSVACMEMWRCPTLGLVGSR